MPEDITYIYTTSEISKRLGIAASTIRKYAAALEAQGYTFTMQNGGRRFAEADIALLTHLRDMSTETKMPIEQIAQRIIDKKPASPRSVSQVHEQRSSVEADDVIPEIMSEFASLRKENEQLRGMVLELTKEVRQLREETRLISASLPGEESQESDIARFEVVEEAPKRAFWQFWKK